MPIKTPPGVKINDKDGESEERPTVACGINSLERGDDWGKEDETESRVQIQSNGGKRL